MVLWSSQAEPVLGQVKMEVGRRLLRSVRVYLVAFPPNAYLNRHQTIVVGAVQLQKEKCNEQFMC